MAGTSPSEYISHHLTNLNQTGHPQISLIDMSLVNLDTLFWAGFCALLACLTLHLVTRRATAGVPGRCQVALEMLVEAIDNQVKSAIHGDRRFITALSLTIIVWIVFMNSMDLLPVDLPNQVIAFFNLDIHYQRIVPTADLNGTMGLSVGIILLVFYYNYSRKGPVGFFEYIFGYPFGLKIYLYPINLIFNLIEFSSQTLSLAMRLFGNMFAGELLFALIALLGATATWWGGGLHLIAGSAWAIFHILVIFLQAYIFMSLTLTYLSHACEENH